MSVSTPGKGCELSVIIPTYNRLSVLQRNLEQTLRLISGANIEVIVVDDCSDDGTWEWLSKIFEGHPVVKRFRLQTNSGPGAARNVGLERAKGAYFLPLDSDCIPTADAFTVMLGALHEFPDYPVLFFPCIAQPAGRRMDNLVKGREISDCDLLYRRVDGEMIPVADLGFLRSHGLKYPELRAGGEGILWIEALRRHPAKFIPEPVIEYWTDTENRICTAKYQLEHAADVAKVADATLELFKGVPLTPESRRAKAARLLASGCYHVLAGHLALGRKRLKEAAGLGELRSLAVLAASVLGTGICRTAFGVFRPEPGRSWRARLGGSSRC